jgi:C4-dicarboxylate-specific signal transduction histidine kinase
VTHLDITSRKLGEELAQRQQAHLAQVARMHTVGALATAVAHEISQPLAAIGIYSNAAAHLLEAGNASPGELAEVLRQIEAQVTRAGEIVGRVRELTRWRNAAKAPIDLCETVAEAIRLTRPMATDRQVAIMLEKPEEPIRVPADHVQIAQVLINLICNGIEAIALADSRQRRIGVRVRRAGDGARITVTDTGPGIRPGWEERIFDIFESDKATGSGMGLAISRSLVEGHGGRLWADIEHKPGAAFHFTLPGTPEGQEDSA